MGKKERQSSLNLRASPIILPSVSLAPLRDPPPTGFTWHQRRTQQTREKKTRSSHPSIIPSIDDMAQAMAGAALAPVAGLGSSALSTRPARLKVQLNSSFLQRPSLRVAPQFQNVQSMSRVTCFERDWLRKDFSVIGFGLIGWLAPSSIPVISGNSLTGLFFSSIGPELAHWPTGPALTSPFWLWMVTWHLGLFIVLTFGQIGFKGRKDGYFL